MGLFKSIGKAFKKVGKAVVKVAPYALAAAATVYTGGAALGATGSFGSAVASGTAKLGLKGAIGNIVTKAVTQAGMGAMQGFVMGGKAGLKQGFKSGLLSGAGEGLIEAGTKAASSTASPSSSPPPSSSSDPGGSSPPSGAADRSGDFVVGAEPDWVAISNRVSSNGLLGPKFVAGRADGGTGGTGNGGGTSPASFIAKIPDWIERHPTTVDLAYKLLKKKEPHYNDALEVAKFEADTIAKNYNGRGGLLTAETNILDKSPRPTPRQSYGPDLGYEWNYNPVTKRLERVGIEPVRPLTPSQPG